jgi:hypothetical protein
VVPAGIRNWNHVTATKRFACVPPNGGKRLNPKAPTVAMVGAASKLIAALLNTSVGIQRVFHSKVQGPEEPSRA